MGHTSEYISDLLTSVANIPGRSTLRASSCSNPVTPRTRRRIACDRAYSVAAPRAWKRLPTELKLLRSTHSFRRDLQTFLFHSVYGHQDTDWFLWCALGLLVGAQYKCLSLYSNSYCNCSVLVNRYGRARVVSVSPGVSSLSTQDHET